MIIQPQPPECRDYRRALPRQVEQKHFPQALSLLLEKAKQEGRWSHSAH
jgi:hypothetical protein